MAKGQSTGSAPGGLSYLMLPWGKESLGSRGWKALKELCPPAAAPPGDAASSLKSFSRKCFVSGQPTQRGGEKIVGTRGRASEEEEFQGVASSPPASHPGLRGQTALPVSAGRGSANYTKGHLKPLDSEFDCRVY